LADHPLRRRSPIFRRAVIATVKAMPQPLPAISRACGRPAHRIAAGMSPSESFHTGVSPIFDNFVADHNGRLPVSGRITIGAQPLARAGPSTRTI